MMATNKTQYFTHHKYSINIPKEMMLQAKIKSQAAGFNEVAPYFRAILSREVMDGNMTLRDIIGEKEINRLGWEKVILNERRRRKSEHRFIKIKIKKVFDIFNPRQYTLF